MSIPLLVERTKLLFDIMNNALFGGALPEVFIDYRNLESIGAGGAAGLCTKVRPDASPLLGFTDRKYAILLSMDLAWLVFESPGQEVFLICDTLLHEMVHEYCFETGISDCASDGVHLVGYRNAATSHGLSCKKGSAGYSLTEITTNAYLDVISNLSDDLLEDFFCDTF